MSDIDYCFHTHTYRCGHAVGSDEEYVLAAIKRGIKVLGFSDHVILKDFHDKNQIHIPGVNRSGVRCDYSYLDDYIDSINNLKEKYKDKIEIHVGFEAEYLPEYLDYYKELLDSKKIEYLILGQHSYLENGKMVYYGSLGKNLGAREYTKDLIRGMSTGLFKYVCHPDIFTTYFGSNDEEYEIYARMIVEASIKYNCPLEINLGGRRRKEIDENYIYANRTFFKIASEYKDSKVIIGFDAHNPIDFEISDVSFSKKLIADYKLNEVKRIIF